MSETIQYPIWSAHDDNNFERLPLRGLPTHICHRVYLEVDAEATRVPCTYSGGKLLRAADVVFMVCIQGIEVFDEECDGLYATLRVYLGSYPWCWEEWHPHDAWRLMPDEMREPFLAALRQAGLADPQHDIEADAPLMYACDADFARALHGPSLSLSEFSLQMRSDTPAAREYAAQLAGGDAA